MSSNKIIERKVPTNHYLAWKIFGSTSSLPGEEAYAHIIYFDDSNPKIIAANLVYVQDWEFQPEGFSKLIEEDLSFNDCLAISTYYFIQSYSVIRTMIDGSLTPIENHLEYIVKSTNGFLLYSFQFEQLAQLILNATPEDAIRMRKLFNKKRSIIDECKQDDEKSSLFKSIVRLRTLTPYVLKPNYEGAKNLFLYATSIA